MFTNSTALKTSTVLTMRRWLGRWQVLVDDAHTISNQVSKQISSYLTLKPQNNVGPLWGLVAECALGASASLLVDFSFGIFVIDLGP